MLAVYFATRRAVGAYRPSPYPGAGTLIRAKATAATLRGTPEAASFGWSPWFEGPLAVHDVPGDHYSILSPSGAGLLASLLDRLHPGDDEERP